MIKRGNGNYKMTQGEKIRQVLVWGAWAVFAITGAYSQVLALPQDGKVVAGSAAIEQVSPDRLNVIQSTDKAIIDWRSFDIDIHEHTDIQTPSSSSINLSRVTGGDPSKILGRLTSNGQFFLINPSGIIFGQHAQIDVSGIVASTSDILNEDFMSGNFKFHIAPSASAIIQNQGTINVAEGGLAAFVAPGVANSGLISARLGRVSLASGNKFTLDLYGDQLVNLVVGSQIAESVLDAQGNKLDALVDNSGSIFADGGRVVLDVNAASGVVDNVIGMKGKIVARSVEQKNGVIILHGGDEGIVNVTGSLDASGKGEGETGGAVHVLGDKVGLFDTASVDVSGDAGGGTALIGGDYKGGGDVDTSTATYMASTATINADALTAGNGGRIILWSDEYTNAHGTVSAQGGAESGSGGFVETSSKGLLDIAGIDLRIGAGGEWLLDPDSVDITNASTNISGSPTFAPTSNDTTTTINVASITALLEAGTSVSVSTTSAGTTTDGDIRLLVDLIVVMNGGAATLTLNADDSIEIKAPITATGGDALGVILDSSQTTAGVVNINSPISTNGGVFTEQSTGTSDPTAVNLRADINTSGSGAVVTFNNPVFLDTNDVKIQSGGGSITFNSDLDGPAGLTLDAGVAPGGSEDTFDAFADIAFGQSGFFQPGVIGGATPLAFLTIDKVDLLIFRQDVNILGALTMTTAATGFTNIDSPLTVGSADLRGTDFGSFGKWSSTGAISIDNSGIFVLDSNSTLDGGLSVTGETILKGDIATKGGEVRFGGPVKIEDSITVDATSEGAFTLGANVIFESTVDGVQVFGSAAPDPNLIVNVGTNGVAVFNDTVGDRDADRNTKVTSLNSLRVIGKSHLDTDLIFIAGGETTFDGEVVLFQDVEINTTADNFSGAHPAGADINLNDNLYSLTFETNDLTLNPGTGGSVFFGGIVGQNGNGTRLGAVDVEQGVNVTAEKDFYAESLSLGIKTAALTGDGEFNGLVDLSGNTLTVAGINFTFHDVNDAGNVSIDHTGLLTMNGLFDIGGSFEEKETATSTGTVLINDGGGVKTNDSNITFNHAITGEGSVLIDSFEGDFAEIKDTNASDPTPDGDAEDTFGLITFSSTINSTGNPFDLTVNAGDETITFTGAVGGASAATALRDLTIVNAGLSTAKTEAVLFSSTLRTTGGVNINNSGLVNGIGAGSTGAWNLDGGFSTTGDLDIDNSITTKGGEVSIGGVLKLEFDATANTILIDTTGGGSNPQGADVSFLSTVDSFDTGETIFKVAAGQDGKILFDGVVGAVNELESLTVLSGTTQIAQNITTAGGVVAFAGPVELLGGNTITIDTTGSSTAAGADITFSNAVYSQSGLFTSLSLDAGNGTGGSVLFGGVVGGSGDGLRLGALEIGDGADGIGAHDVTAMKDVYATSFKQTGSAGDGVTDFQGLLDLTGNTLTVSGVNFIFNDVNDAGAASITHSGLVQWLGDASFGSTFTDIDSGSAGTTFFGDGSSITTANANIEFDTDITGLGDVLWYSGPGVGNITLNDGVTSVDATANGPFNLTVNSGTGTTTFNDAIGANRALNSLTFVDTHDLTFAETLTLTGALTQNDAATGLTTFTGAVNVDSAELRGEDADSATSFLISQTFNSTGAVSIDQGADFLDASAATGPWLVEGGFSALGSGAALLGNNINTKGGEVRFVGDVVLHENVGIDTTNAEDFTPGANVIFEGEVDTDGSDSADETLTINAGTGGTVVFQDRVGETDALGSLTVHAGKVDINNTILTAGGVVDLNGPVTITNNVTIDTTATGDDGTTHETGASVTFANTLDSLSGEFNDLTINAGTGGTVIFGGQVGDEDGLELGTLRVDGDLTVDGSVIGALNLQAFADVFVQTIDIDAGTSGVVEFHGLLDAIGQFTVDIDGGAVILNDVKTFNGGTVTVTNNGVLTIALGSVLDLDGAFDQDGSGEVDLGGEIYTTDDNISFNGAVTLTRLNDGGVDAGPVILSTGFGEGNIDFASTVDGALTGSNLLTMNAGSGNIDFNAAAGSVERLGDVLIESVQDFTADSSFTARSITQITAVENGTTTFTGAVNTNSNTVDMTGINFVFHDVTTTNGGEFLIFNSGLLTLNGALDLDGRFFQGGNDDGLGAVEMADASSIATTQNDIVFNGVVTLLGTGTSISLDTTGIDDVDPGLGDVIFDQAVEGPNGLNIAAGDGNVEFRNTVGDLEPLVELIVSSSSMTSFSDDVTTTGPISISTMEYTEINNGLTMTSAAGDKIDFDAVVLNIDSSETLVIDGSGGAGGGVEFDGAIQGPGGLEIDAGSTGNVDFFGKVGFDVALANAIAEFEDVQLAIESLGLDIELFNVLDAKIPSPLDHLTVVNSATTTISDDVLTTGPISVTTSIETIIPGTTIESLDGEKIDFDNLRLTGDYVAILSVGGADGGVEFDGTVDGPGGLRVAAAGGNIDFLGTVGFTTALDFLLIESGDVITFTGSIDTDGARGIDITGNTLTIGGPVTTEADSGGPFRFKLVNGFTQTGGPFTIDGLGVFQTTGANADIILDDPNNAIKGMIYFNTADGDVELDNGVTDTVLSGVITEETYFDFFGYDGETYSKYFGDKGIVIPTFNVNGDLMVTTGGMISDAGPLTVTGEAYFITDVDNRDIVLDNLDSVYNRLRFETGSPVGSGLGAVWFENGLNGGNLLTLNSGGSTTAGDFWFATDTDLDIVSPLTSVHRNINIYVGADFSLNVEAPITAEDDISIRSGDATFLPVGDVTSTSNGDIRVVTERFLDMNDGAEFLTGVGRIRLDAGGDIWLGRLITQNSTNWAVEVRSGDQIFDGGDAGGNDIDAPNGRVNFFAENGTFQNKRRGVERKPELDVRSIDVQSILYNPWKNTTISVTENGVQRTQQIHQYTNDTVLKTNFIPLGYVHQVSLSTHKSMIPLRIHFVGDTFSFPFILVEAGKKSKGAYEGAELIGEDLFGERPLRFAPKEDF